MHLHIHHGKMTHENLIVKYVACKGSFIYINTY